MPLAQTDEIATTLDRIRKKLEKLKHELEDEENDARKHTAAPSSVIGRNHRL